MEVRAERRHDMFDRLDSEFNGNDLQGGYLKIYIYIMYVCVRMCTRLESRQ